MKSIRPPVGPEDELRHIVGYPNYKVTRRGAIVSFFRRKPIVLAQTPSRTGHLRVLLYSDDGRPRLAQVHRVVLTAFDRPPLLDEQCRHLDGNPTNNHIDNLRWGTAQDNADDRTVHGTQPVGDMNPFAKLSSSIVREIRCLASCGADMAEVAAMFDVSKSTVCRAASGFGWQDNGTPVDFRKTDSERYSKLSAHDVIEIRRRHAAGESLGELAAAFGVGKPNVCLIVNRKTWKNLPDD